VTVVKYSLTIYTKKAVFYVQGVWDSPKQCDYEKKF